MVRCRNSQSADERDRGTFFPKEARKEEARKALPWWVCRQGLLAGAPPKRKDPKHTIALRITQVAPHKKAFAFCTNPATEPWLAWRLCDRLSPRRHLRRLRCGVVVEQRVPSMASFGPFALGLVTSQTARIAGGKGGQVKAENDDFRLVLRRSALFRRRCGVRTTAQVQICPDIRKLGNAPRSLRDGTLLGSNAWHPRDLIPCPLPLC